MGIQAVDTARIRRERQHPTPKKERHKVFLQSQRNLKIDSSINTAFLEVNSFASGNRLRRFFKTSFKKIHQQNISNLVVDLRGNGGGSVILSNLLTKYISDKPFKIADTLYALKR